MRIGVRAALGGAGAAAGVVLLAFPAALTSAAQASEPALAPASPPAEYGAAAQGKAIHENYNAVASVDPALAASRATAQVSPSGSPPVQLSSYGYSNDPGTLAGAVLFAPGNPTTPSNFPGLAEAFFPVPNQQHVAKCVFNNDATDTPRSGVCDQTRTDTEYALADVQPTNKLGPSAEGYASVAGTTFGNGVPLVASHVTSLSLVVPNTKGELTVTQENRGTNIAITGTPITVASFEASTHLTSTKDQVTGTATCSIDMVIAGQHVPVSQVQAALSALPKPPAGSPLVYAFTGPSKPVVAQDTESGAGSCTGAILEISNPTTGNSVTYTFGETDARAAKLGTLLAGLGPLPTSVLGSVPADSSTAPPAAPGPAAAAATDTSPSAPASNEVVATTPTGSTVTLAPAPPNSAPALAAPAPTAPSRGVRTRLVTRKVSAVPIGIVTAVGATALGLGGWALIAAVAALAKARGTRLSGI
ncbi:MAG: hypothetical protein NVSMB12_12340 [Acidimicrobiales bacterium]